MALQNLELAFRRLSDEEDEDKGLEPGGDEEKEEIDPAEEEGVEM
ncbi:MAG: hypothetical protein Q8P49_00220 [Candidatus Liptonbacteria bacterium]|nr:hypothetical protein [Candidatus Liptonbacteria bacterium]